VVSPQQVQHAILSSFNVAPDSLSVMPTEPEDFVVFLPNSSSTDRVFNGGAPLHGPGFTLFFRHWTKVEHGHTSVLALFVHIELRGIPVHAWSRTTTQQLLGPVS
jgi:hypothetical protein